MSCIHLLFILFDSGFVYISSEKIDRQLDSKGYNLKYIY